MSLGRTIASRFSKIKADFDRLIRSSTIKYIAIILTHISTATRPCNYDFRQILCCCIISEGGQRSRQVATVTRLVHAGSLLEITKVIMKVH